MITVDVQYACPAAPPPGTGEFRTWVASTLAGRRDRAELTIRIVGEDEGRELNERWRHKHGPTNVLSFPASGTAEQVPEFLGDIVICAPVVAREAQTQHKAETAHWAHLVVHGTLHLLGYDHECERDAQEMESIEISILDTLGFGNPYQACADE